MCKTMAEGTSNVIGDDVMKSSGHTNGPKLVQVRLILVKTEEISVGKVGYQAWINVIVVDTTEEEMDGFNDARAITLYEANEDVQGVHEQAVGFASVLMTNGVDDVARGVFGSEGGALVRRKGCGGWVDGWLCAYWAK